MCMQVDFCLCNNCDEVCVQAELILLFCCDCIFFLTKLQVQYSDAKTGHDRTSCLLTWRFIEKRGNSFLFYTFVSH